MSRSPKKSSGAKSKGAPNSAKKPHIGRIPSSIDGIQVNCCRTVGCKNFGVEPLPKVHRGRPKKGQKPLTDGYRIIGNKNTHGGKRLYCKDCKTTITMKSNQGIKDEIARITTYRNLIAEPSCKDPACRNHGYGVHSHPSRYSPAGTTPSGSQRYRCKACKKRFSLTPPTARQRKSEKNRLAFKSIISKLSIKRMAFLTDLAPKAVYGKIDFIHRQCMTYQAYREKALRSLDIPRLFISTDRQDYIVNWSTRFDRRNTQLTAVGSADNKTSYVFGMHLNFDPSMDQHELEQLADLAGDKSIKEPWFREYARYWLEDDFEVAAAANVTNPDGDDSIHPKTINKINATMDSMAALPEEDATEFFTKGHNLPGSHGVQLHYPYTVHAHFRVLRQLIGHAGKIRFYMDHDNSLTAGCLTAFASEIMNERADAFIVQFQKCYNNDTRREMIRNSKTKLNLMRVDDPRLANVPDWKLVLINLHLQILQAQKDTSGKPYWYTYPLDSMNEPEKMVHYLTDRGNTDTVRLAHLLGRASLHGIDRFFMQLRRMLMMLERPFKTPSNDGRIWNGYGAYNPQRIQQLIDIYRVYYNFVKAGNDKKTPAMRLGLAKGKVRMEDILYFDPNKPR